MQKDFTVNLRDFPSVDWDSAAMRQWSAQYAKEARTRAQVTQLSMRALLDECANYSGPAVKMLRTQQEYERKSVVAIADHRAQLPQDGLFYAALRRLQDGKTAAPTLQHKQLVGIVKATKEAAASGHFAGYLSVFNAVDLGDDSVDPGAYKLTIQRAEQQRQTLGNPYLWPVLAQHDMHQPIGGFTLAREDAKGLYVEGDIDLNIDAGRTVWSGIKNGYLRGLSIGYDVVKSYYLAGVRHLQQIELAEGSVVTMPMQPLANVTSYS